MQKRGAGNKSKNIYIKWSHKLHILWIKEKKLLKKFKVRYLIQYRYIIEIDIVIYSSKTSDRHELLFNLSDKAHKARMINMLPFQILGVTMHGEIYDLYWDLMSQLF